MKEKNKKETARGLYEIEIALAKCDTFNFLRNIIAFNVNGMSSNLNIWHECDMLVLSKAGYLTEIEIKRSWADFLADFKKNHKHGNRGIIKYFYYCLPECILEKAYNKLEELNVSYTGIITYDENLLIKVHGKRIISHDGNYSYHIVEQHPNRKLFLEEQLQIARFGAMRAIKLKEKFIKNGLNL